MNFARQVIAQSLRALRAQKGDMQTVEQIALDRWGPRIAEMSGFRTKAGVPVHDSGDADTEALLPRVEGDLGREVFTLPADDGDPVRRLLELGAFRGEPHAPFRWATTRPQAGFVSESKAIPVRRAAFDKETLVARKIATAVVLSPELLQDASPATEARLSRLLTTAVSDVATAALLSQADSSSITFGVPTLQGTSARGTLGDMVDYLGKFSRPCWMLSRSSAARLALQDAALVDWRESTMLGQPMILSSTVPTGSDGDLAALVDLDGLAILDLGVEVSVNTDGMIELNDAPQGAGDTPTAASATLASLFQLDAIAIKMTRRIGWRVEPGRIAVGDLSF